MQILEVIDIGNIMRTTSIEIRTSWFGIFNDLKRLGWSHYRIETEFGIAKTTQLGWKAGAEPKHSDGERMIALWSSVTGNDRDSLPMETKYPSAYRRRRRG